MSIATDTLNAAASSGRFGTGAQSDLLALARMREAGEGWPGLDGRVVLVDESTPANVLRTAIRTGFFGHHAKTRLETFVSVLDQGGKIPAWNE